MLKFKVALQGYNFCLILKLNYFFILLYGKVNNINNHLPDENLIIKFYEEHIQRSIKPDKKLYFKKPEFIEFLIDFFKYLIGEIEEPTFNELIDYCKNDFLK